MIAQLILYGYPLVVLMMFQRLSRHEALIWSILCGYLFLPERIGIDLPLLPQLNKVLIPSFTAGLMCLLLPDADGLKKNHRRSTRATALKDASDNTASPRRGSAMANICLLVIFLVPIGVFATNTEAVVYGPRRIEGVRPYDIFSMILNMAL